MKNIVLIGPPGSGKDTQIEKLARYFDFELVSTGDIIRTLAEKNEKCRHIMEAGGLVDDKIISAELDMRISAIGQDKNIVFDGYPRTLHQAELLNEILLHRGRTLDRVIYISLEEEVIVDRLSRRKICSICGLSLLPGIEKCPKCGGRPIRRSDDEPAVIIRRVQTFLENTLPLINYYRNKDILIGIDGDQSISAVAEDIKEGLGQSIK